MLSTVDFTDISDPTTRSADTSDDVVLVNDDGRSVGQAPRLAVHGADTPLHLAFSVYLFDDAGRVLLTRRALTKRTWPGVWTNSCCGHPRPGEAMTEAVSRRVREELGAEAHGIREELPDFRYRAVDAAGVVENELCPVFVGRVHDVLAPDPSEVAEYAWVEWVDLVRTVTSMPVVFSPWSIRQIPQLAERLGGSRS